MKKQFTELIGAFSALIFFSLLTTSTVQAQYCTAASTATGFEFISEVSYDTYTNSSGDQNYADNTAGGSIGDIAIGISTTISVEVTEVWFADDIFVYIDYNGDGDFTVDEKVGEALQFDDGSDPQSVDVSITVPAGAVEGETRLRVKLQDASAGPGSITSPLDAPCGDFLFGEIEDYLINITSSSCTPIAVDAVVDDECGPDGGVLSYTISATVSEVNPGSIAPGTPLAFLYTLNGDPATSGNSEFIYQPGFSFELLTVGAVEGGVGEVTDVVNGTFTLAFNTDPICFVNEDFQANNSCPPANDDVCNAIGLVVDGTAQGPFDNTNATVQEGEVAPGSGGFNGSAELPIWGDSDPDNPELARLDNTIWFTFVGPETGRLSIDACTDGGVIDNQIAVYSSVDGSCDFADFTLLGANDDTQADAGCQAANIFSAALELCVEPGETYYVQLDGFGFTTGPQGLSALTLTALDGEACSCTLPVIDDPTANILETAPNCEDPDNLGYNITYIAPANLGTAGAWTVTYTIGGETFTLNVPQGESVTAPQLIPNGETVTSIIDLADPACSELSTLFPLGPFVNGQPADACDPDCLGNAGGPAQPGTPCTIDVEGDGVWSADCECIGVPDNDNCENAEVATCGGTYEGNTLSATSVEGQAYCGGSAPGATNGGVWYSLELSNSASVTLDLSGSLFDTQIFLYSGVCGDLTCIDGDDDGGTGLDSQLLADLEAGSYLVYVTGFGGSRGAYTLNISCINAECSPTVDALPVDAEGAAIEDCVNLGGEYFVAVTLGEGLFNDFYNVSVNGGEPTQIAAGGSGQVGPVPANEEANINVTGVSNNTCGGSAVVSVDLCPPSNDLPCNAIGIEADGLTNSYSNIGAGFDVGEPFTSSAPTVWFTVVGPESGRLNVSTCGDTDFDTVLRVYEVEQCGDYTTYTSLAVNDDNFAACGSTASELELCATPGTLYYIQVRGFAGSSGVFDLTATEVLGPNTCSCELPSWEGAFQFTNAESVCDGPEPGFTLVFQTPADLDLGSQSGFTFTYDWADNPNEDPISVLVTEGPVTIPEVFPLGTPVTVVQTIDAECEDADGSPYPFTLTGFTLDESGCDPDCLGNPGGPAQPGTPCTNDNLEPGIWNDACECIPTPANDLCDNAEPVACGAVINGSTATASTTGNPTAFCGTTPTAPGVWYSFIGDGLINTLSLCGSSFDTKINVYTGSCDALVCEAGNDDNFGACGPGFNSQLTINSEAGVEYLILVNGFNGATGDFVLTVTCESPLPNDACGGAETIACGDVVAGSTAAATVDSDVTGPTCGTSITAPGVWYSFIGDGQSNTISLCGSSFDTKLSVFTGECTALECLDGNDDACGLQSELTINSEEGVEYLILVHGFGSGSGDFSLAVTCAGPPENDEPETATLLACSGDGSAQVIDGTTSGASESLAPIECEGFTSASAIDVWFQFDADGSSDYEFVETTAGDFVMEYFSVGEGGALTSLGCTDFGDELASDEGFFFQGLEAGAYAIRMYSFDGFGNPAVAPYSVAYSCFPVAAGASLTGTVADYVSCEGRDVRVRLYTPGTENLVGEFNAPMAGDNTFTVTEIPAGTFDVFVRLNGFLQDGFASVVLVDGENALAVPLARQGDLNNSGDITFQDFSFLNTFFPVEAYDVAADYVCSGTINFQDFSAINEFWDQNGDVPPLAPEVE